MFSYCSPTDIVPGRVPYKVVRELSTEGTARALTDDQVQVAVEYASGSSLDPVLVDPAAQQIAAILRDAVDFGNARVSSYLSGRYTLPVPRLANGAALPELRAAASDLARWHLYSRRESGPPAAVEDAYQNAVKWLGDLARGAARLDLTLIAEADVAAGNPSFVGVKDLSGTLFATPV